MCVCACVLSDLETEHMNNHIDHTRKAFHLYGSACDFQFLTMNERIVTLGTLVYFLSSVGLYVSL